MPLWPDAILLDGEPLPLGSVLADLTIHHGRQTLADEPTATTCQLTLADVAPAFVQDFHVGAELAVTVSDGAVTVPRFRGRVTDASLDVDELTIIAAGRLSTLSQYEIGAGAWPVEAWSARVIRCFDEAGDFGPPNLVTNPGFEKSIAGWSTSGQALYDGAVLTRSTTEHHSGAGSGEVYVPDAYRGIHTDFVAIPGDVYTFSAWIKAPAGWNIGLYVHQSDGSNGTQTFLSSVAGDWQQITLSGWVATAPDAGLTLRAELVGVSGVFYVDDVDVRGQQGLLELQADPDFDPQIAGRDPATAGSTGLADYLAFLAPMVGAAIVDQPDGRILVQVLGGRRLDALTVVDPADVVYAPVWEQVLPDGNIVTVRYTGDQSESVTVQDDASIARYGRLPRTIDTTFTAEADARTRANQALSRGAFPRWNIREAPAIRGLPLDVGAPVEISSLPASSPFPLWTPVLEGWTDSLTADVWTMRLALSDPLLSGLVLPWDAIPAPDPAYQWDTIDPATDWTEALTLAALSQEIVHAR